MDAVKAIVNLPGFLTERYDDKGVGEEDVWNAIRNAVNPERLVQNLAEVFRVSAAKIEEDLREAGLKDVVTRLRIQRSERGGAASEAEGALSPCTDTTALDPFPEVFRVQAVPALDAPVSVCDEIKEVTEDLFGSIARTSMADPMVDLYRTDSKGYCEDFLANLAPEIDDYLKKRFPNGALRYLVTSGIGANEQFCHFVSRMNNANPDRRLLWLPINSPRKLTLLPDDARPENTLFMEFSRSGLTEETVKIHEYTPRECARIVYANEGPLRRIAERDGNLVQFMPDRVSGRFGRNKTPILMAPMHVAGMDVRQYWGWVAEAVERFDLANPDSLPHVVAKYIHLHQRRNNINLIYLGCNDDALLDIADELIQFWNEGVNKDKNDIMMTRFFGQPRDSHMNIEGLLANNHNKMGIFFLRTAMRQAKVHPLCHRLIDPVNPDHQGLELGDEEVVLAMANYKRFSELMPTLLIAVPNIPTLAHSAIVGQLFADITFCYSKLKGTDPGSNPEVKTVRGRSSDLLKAGADLVRRGGAVGDLFTN